MGKFTSKIKTKTTKTVNYEGATAYKMSPKLDLYTSVSSWLVNEPKFYGNVDDETERILSLIENVNKTDPEFILKLAAFARNELHLRSAPTYILAIAAMNKNPFTRWYVPSIVKRADELAEVISILQVENENLGDKTKGTMLPNGLRRGLADVFGKFSRYALQKYNRKPVTMQDVIRLVHPKPHTEEQEKLYKDIASDNLGSAETWETLISGKGSTKENWEKAVEIMPIMATIRNLRNLLDKEVSDDALRGVTNKLSDHRIIRNSKQFPFRFLSAYKSIENNSNHNAGRLLTALNTAIEISISNLPRFDGVTAAFADNSGSMDHPISAKSEVRAHEIANIFAAIISKLSQNNIIGTFADEFKVINFAAQDSILSTAQRIRQIDVGGSTNGYLSIKYLNDKNIKVDRIFTLSDEQMYDSSTYWSDGSLKNEWNKYKKNVNPNCYLYSIDLVGYGTTQIPENDPHVLKIAGWSDNILKYIPYFEKEKQSMIDHINEVNRNTYI